MSFKKYISKLDNEKWSKEKRKQKRKKRGLRKGDGQLPVGGVSSGVSLGDAGGVSESFGRAMFSGIQSLNTFRHENEEGIDNREVRKPVDKMGDIGSEDNQEMDTDTDMEGDEDEFSLDDQPEDDQGVTRTVKGAHLVYKKQDDEGQFEELWIFPMNKGLDTELSVRKNILSGTDIPEGKTESEDGSQKYEIWTAGNAQLMKITGLPQ